MNAVSLIAQEGAVSFLVQEARGVRVRSTGGALAEGELASPTSDREQA